MLTALFAVALLDAHGVPLQGEALVDGAWCAAQACPLEPGRHVLQDGRTRHAFYLAPGQATARVIASDVPAHYGVWMRRQGELPDRVELPDVTPGVRALSGYTLAGALPESVRVARHADNNCGNPIERIDEVPLESYVAGVVHGEIGVFRAAGTGAGVSIPRAEVDGRVLASFETFAIAARTYVVWWVLRKGADADFHIHDGPCNQVYQDARDPVSEEAAARTAGQILVPPNARDEIDKHEYASSCARHGTLPSFRNPHQVRMEDIVPDDGLERVCVGSWCGHDRYRMAHQDNPFLEAGNRCLVRGVCQWGSLERSVRGDSSAEILAHYQPDLIVYSPSDQEALGRLELEVVDGEGTGLAGVRVELRREDDQLIEFTAAGGMARFSDLAPGVWRVSAWAEGFAPENVELRVTPSEVTRHRLRLAAPPSGSDAGSPLADSGSAQVDASAVDASVPGLVSDAGDPVVADSGQEEVTPGAGCSCGVTSPQSGLPMTLLFALVWWRRIGASRRRHDSFV